MEGLGLSETEKQIAALVLAIGLIYVFVRVGYEYLLGERFTLYHVFHPVKRINSQERRFIKDF